MARKLADILSVSEPRKDTATEACGAREELAADASLKFASFKAAVRDVEGVANPTAFDQAASRPGAVAKVFEIEERWLWSREVYRSLLR